MFVGCFGGGGGGGGISLRQQIEHRRSTKINKYDVNKYINKYSVVNGCRNMSVDSIYS